MFDASKKPESSYCRWTRDGSVAERGRESDTVLDLADPVNRDMHPSVMRAELLTCSCIILKPIIPKTLNP